MKKVIVFLMSVIMLASLATAALAANDEEKAPAKESKSGAAGGNFSVGGGPVGNVFIVDSNPDLNPGAGGYLFFDYRWSPQFSTQFGFMISDQDGTGISKGDDDILLMGFPTFDLKFYMLSNPSRWDPYALIGMGIYILTEGSVSNGTKAVGIGANLGLGFDYYVSEKLSLGLGAIFRSIGLIDSTNSTNNGTALFPFTMLGNIAYHF
jgi:outer membrane protein W